MNAQDGEIVGPEQGRIEDGLRAEWRSEMGRSATHFMRAGAALIRAKAELPQGRWLPFVATLGISARTAQRQMQIASDPNLLQIVDPNAPGLAHLPMSQSALEALSGLPEDDFRELRIEGKIRPDISAAEIKTALVELREPPPPSLASDLPVTKFGVIAADPPWPWRAGPAGMDRSPETHYRTMTLKKIAAEKVGAIALPDAALFLWAVSANLPAALEVIKAWGFEYVSTGFVWVKDGPPGLGHTTRKRSELCLLAKRGNPERIDAGVDEVIEAPRGRHSEKPEEAYRRMQRLYPGPYVDLYSRRERDGWHHWGSLGSLPPPPANE